MADDSLVRSAIGDVPLFLGGEVDCVEGIELFTRAMLGRLTIS